jgi:hypothetical protein
MLQRQEGWVNGTTYDARGKIAKVTKMKSAGLEAIATCFGKSQSLTIEDTFG